MTRIEFSKANEYLFLVSIREEMSPSRLLALPNEIILGIIDDIPTRDIKSFALCNKAIYNLCGTAIRRIFEERYAVIRLGGPRDLPRGYTRLRAGDDPSREYHPLLFLDRILSKPNIAQYPTELQIELHVDDEDEMVDSEGAALDNAISTWGSELASIGANNPWLTGDIREEWQCAFLDPTNKFYHLGILLTMLPNVESITITNGLEEAAPLTDMIFAISEANRDPSSPVHRKTLANLHEVALETISGYPGEDKRIYEYFAALPSMRSLYGKVILGHGEAPMILPHRTRDKDCQLKVVKFLKCEIDPDYFDGLLRITAALKDFTYHHVNHRAGNLGFDALGIVQALAKHASHSLERLELTAGQSVWNEPHRRQCISSLRDFARLRVLRIDDKLLQAPHPGGQVTRLVDVLPASIKLVRLVRELGQEGLERVFAGLAEEKEEKSPVLKKIVVEGRTVSQRSLVDELKAVGVEVKGTYMI